MQARDGSTPLSAAVQYPQLHKDSTLHLQLLLIPVTASADGIARLQGHGVSKSVSIGKPVEVFRYDPECDFHATQTHMLHVRYSVEWPTLLPIKPCLSPAKVSVADDMSAIDGT